MKQAELLASQSNVEEIQPDNKPLIIRTQVEGTPFWIIGNEEKGYMITMAKYRMTEDNFKTQNEAMQYIQSHNWNLVMTLMLTIIDHENKHMTKQQDTNK